MIIFTGDLGHPKEYFFIKELIEKIKLPTYFCIGNHDKKENLIHSGLIKEKDTKYFEIENFSIYLFDSSSGIFDENKAKKLQKELNKHSHNIIFTHYPLINTNKKYFDRTLGLKDNQFINLFSKNKTKNTYIFSGHYHCFDEINTQNIIQVICPAVIMEIKEKDQNNIITDSFNFGYNEIELQKNQLKYQKIMFTGFGKDKAW